MDSSVVNLDEADSLGEFDRMQSQLTILFHGAIFLCLPLRMKVLLRLSLSMKLLTSSRTGLGNSRMTYTAETRTPFVLPGQHQGTVRGRCQMPLQGI
jgi:hypothetical protein